MKAGGDRRQVLFVGLVLSFAAAWALGIAPISLIRDNWASTLAFVDTAQLISMEGAPQQALFLDGLGLLGWVVRRRARPRRSKVRRAQVDIR